MPSHSAPWSPPFLRPLEPIGHKYWAILRRWVFRSAESAPSRHTAPFLACMGVLATRTLHMVMFLRKGYASSDHRGEDFAIIENAGEQGSPYRVRRMRRVKQPRGFDGGRGAIELEYSRSSRIVHF